MSEANYKYAVVAFNPHDVANLCIYKTEVKVQINIFNFILHALHAEFATHFVLFPLHQHQVPLP